MYNLVHTDITNHGTWCHGCTKDELANSNRIKRGSKSWQSIAMVPLTTDKGEVGGSSPPRPTIDADILTFRGCRTGPVQLSL